MREIIVPRYLIQHQTETETTLISSGVQQLEPIAQHLAELDQTGHVVLIDAETNEVIIRVAIELVAHNVSGDE